MTVQIPDTWIVRKVADAGDVIVGQQKLRDESPFPSHPYLRVANVQDGYLDLEDVLTMPFSDPEKYVLEPGDVLLCEGQSKELVGRAALFEGSSNPILFQNSILRFRAKQDVLPEFALLVFRAYQKSGVFARISKATTGIAHLGLKRLLDLPFPLPPLELQRQLSDLANAVQIQLDLAERSLSAVSRRAARAMAESVDSTILGIHAPTWRGKEAGTSRWPLEPISALVDDAAPIVYGVLKPGPHDPNGIRIIRGQDLQQGHIRTDALRRVGPSVADKYRRSTLAPGDVLLGIIRHTRVAIVPPDLSGANITQGTARIRPGEAVDSRYLAHWMSGQAAQSWLRAHLRGIDMPGLNLRDVRRLPIPVAPLEVQQEIAEHLDNVAHQLALVESASLEASQRLVNLEREALVSLAYGAIAERLLAQLPEASEMTEGAGRLIDEQHGPSRTSASSLDGNRNVAQPEGPQRRAQGSLVDVGSAGAAHVTADELIAALAIAEGSLSPDELFVRLGLAEIGVDSFYLALREVISDGRATIRRVDIDRVEIGLQS